MTNTLRPRAAATLTAVGTAALALAVVIVITGGFTLTVGSLRVSAHTLSGPLVVAVLAWLGALGIAGRAGVGSAFASIGELCASRALAVALVSAVVVAGVGIGLGTHAASGADAAGYVSQSRLIAEGRLTTHEPLATMVLWPNATDAFAPLGYRAGPQPGDIVPTYPPGLPLLMAVARWGGGEWAPFVVVPLLGAVLVLATFALGAQLHSRGAGAIGAVLMATSPIVLFQVVQPMSDVPAAALWALAPVLLLGGRPVAGGVAAAMAVLVRPNLAPLWLAIGFACLATRRYRPWVAFGAPFAIGASALAIVQWNLYGTPLGSGHGSVSDLFSLTNIAQNARDYSMRVWRGEWPALALATGAALWLLVGQRVVAAPSSREVDVPALAPITRAFAVVAAMLLVCYLPYGVFPDWSYLRFLLPAFPFAFALAGALVTNASRQLPTSVQGIAIVLALAAVASANATVARREQAFDLWRFEGRYRTTGRYLEAVLPKNAVVVTSQESTAVHYYAGLPIVHWDVLAADLDAAVGDLQALGRSPVLVVEDWEAPLLRARFPMSTLARLDWIPRAEIGETTRVRLYDPADLEQGNLLTDRLR